MSGNWDDSDSEVEIVHVEKPVVLPRSRTTSVAKSLEKVTILENPIVGSTKDDDDSSDGESVGGSVASTDAFEEMTDEILVIDYDADINLQKHIAMFECDYRNIIEEFADVEIFMISVDSLIIEAASHKYHNWTLAGQTLVLNTQIDRFLDQFVKLGGRFKLVIFSDLALQFARDTTLSFVRSAVISHLRHGPFASDIEIFTSPVDPVWERYLTDLTPSFMMISTDNVTSEVCSKDDVDMTPHFETIVLDLLARSIAVVPLYHIVVNFSTVNAYYIQPNRLVTRRNHEQFMAAHWETSSEAYKTALNPTVDISDCANSADLWAKIIHSCKTSGQEVSAHFDTLCCAVLLSALVCARRAVPRVYLEEKTDGKRGLDLIRDRRLLLKTAAAYFEKVNWKTAKFPVSDLWDGRMVLGLFDAIVAGEEILPYRIQEEFGRAHLAAGLHKAIPTDTAEKLFDPVPEPEHPLHKLPFVYEAHSTIVDEFAKELTEAKGEATVKELDVEEAFKKAFGWKFKKLEEDFSKEPEKLEDKWQLKRANKARQFLSRWYELFANSLEGRGSNLLVDFSRTPKGFATNDDDEKDKDKKKDKPWAGQKKGGGGGAKKGKEPVKSKKELILEANKNAKANKIVEGEKNKIKFATQQGKNAIYHLENLFDRLELPETRALCVFETTARVARDLVTEMAGQVAKERRRHEGVKLVGLVKKCFTKHWEFLDERQKDQIVDIWVSLGFDAPDGRKASSDAKAKKLDLELNMIYYQLQFAGELVDIQSDPQKDDRVTGFAPDAWQRRMLDVVDRGNSALIVAPTSAGKTFVSYYCIEKVLRASDDDVVIYVSPSKALTNQVCGSIYARFRNKSMTQGRALFGTLTMDYGTNALNCQVLVTVPECLEQILLSTNPVVQEFASRIKHVIFDEVHCIGASEQAAVWEHLLLLIRCPFLALSATIGNAEMLHKWLETSEKYKSNGKRKVDLIVYSERYSELELSIQKVKKSLAFEEQDNEESAGGPVAQENGNDEEGILAPFMPYGVYMPEKLRMFGIPDDQQLTARQILELYTMMSEVDEATKKEFEPCHFFGYKAGHNVWLSRSDIRNMEKGLKKRFLDWLKNDEDKMQKVLNKLGRGVEKQLEYRAVPFSKLKTALNGIVPLVDELREKRMLPAICFNDDRTACEQLAEALCVELENRQRVFEQSAEYKKYAIKDEDKLLKQAKRKRDEAEKKKKGKKDEDSEPVEVQEEVDPFAAQRIKLNELLARFKLRGRVRDNDIYDKMIERMTKNGKGRESTQILLRLMERGIGFHHPGISMVEKGAVEVLFRSGHLAVIFSTSTLALGMNMPCKTVMFGVDTENLTPLLFRQMSGRAGRRGFDHSGQVIFMGIPTSKVRRLLTASLSNLHGNPPYTTSFILRLLAYVHQPMSISEKTGLEIGGIGQRTQVALAVLRNSFSLFTRGEAQDGQLQKQLRLYTAFAIQLLRHLHLIDRQCSAVGLADLACSLQEGEPGNLVFIHLLQKQVFHKLCAKYQGEKLKRTLLTVFAHLFVRVYLPPSMQPSDKSSYKSDTNLKVFLDDLPKDVKVEVEEYNQTVKTLYARFTAAAGGNGRLVDNRFAISGAQDSPDYLVDKLLMSPVYEGYCHDDSFLPLLDIEPKDHRGRRLHLNAFAIDFWHMESRSLLRTVNRLQAHTVWYTVHAFSTMLRKISDGLTVVTRPQDPFTEACKVLADEYDYKFRSAFAMKQKMY